MFSGTFDGQYGHPFGPQTQGHTLGAKDVEERPRDAPVHVCGADLHAAAEDIERVCPGRANSQ